MARTPRPSKVPQRSFLKPINVKDFGDPEKDPCFGKHFDLTTIECQSCGDVELCQIATMVKFKNQLSAQEKNGNNLDLVIGGLELNKDVSEYVKDKLAKGIRPHLVNKRAMKKFNITESQLNKILENGCTRPKEH